MKAQGNSMVKYSKVKDKKCKEKTSVARRIKENKLERRRNTNVSRHRRKALKVNRKDALDCCVLLTRLDVGDVKNSPKNMSGKVKQRNKCDQPRLKHRPTQKAEEPKMKNSHAFLRLSPEPRRRRMASLNAEAVNSLLLFRDDPLSSRKTQLPKDNHNEHEPKAHKPKRKATQTQQDVGCKNASVTQDQSIDWLSIFAPTPRRQAGLTAATLLKLTSAQYTNKRQKKREVTHDAESTTQCDAQRKCDHKIWTQHTRQKKIRGKRRLQGCSGSSAQAVTPELKDCAKAPLQHPPAPSFSPQVKEEQVENQVSSCYCCTQEKCVQYCHRLSLFLRDKSFQGQDSVFHHHHHHHHLPALGTHSYTCFPGYYFHLCHPSDTSQEHVYPSSRKGTKLLGTQSSGASGISHPVYCCTSVEPCFDPCTVSSYRSYSSMIPAICHMGCTTCNHTVKKEYPPAVSGLHSPPSLPMCPSPRVLTGCPISPVPPAGQSVHTPAKPSEPSQPAAPLRHNFAQSTMASRASQVDSVVIRNRKHTPSASGVRSIVNKWRHKSTNGWRPVGLPFQREVFTVGEETPVLRTCFEAVQRDGDVIQVRDTVLLKSGPRKKSLPYVAKVSALWEDPDSGELMMSLFWYYRPEHTQGGRKPNVHCENEVFASRHQDVNSVACIEDKCYVLTLAQYCRFRALLKRQQEGVGCSAASVVPPALEHGLPTYHCVPPDMDPHLVFFCRHVYDFRYGRLLKNLH
ncbi:bromo adjacent homology domain-containing 1 protein isoform X2 [Boleophthalmus pectinirostris]|uniref:bromo adjacent homology domain-containing 1 protein isoform X2 n=1 Tax=Boleophthalmus pectinirostris TaxID=150288 RepID=UPI002430214C|nr:bromo adjacent homology domain-containing 1 protein isoform X2 [Boleophthalmus pectinirostris]